MAVEDNEFVAAPAGDQIARADDAGEPACDLRQKLVAGGVAQAVVDLLEIVEIEEHHGEFGPIGPERNRQLLLEAPAVGQVGDGVEPRHPIDLVLGVAALGDVLDDDDRAFALHTMDGDFKRPAIAGLERNDEVGPGLGVAKQGLRQAA